MKDRGLKTWTEENEERAAKLPTEEKRTMIHNQVKTDVVFPMTRTLYLHSS